ncbi:hypothetical protein [Dermacoccus nishinomiyaensis]|uniref:hypothetical protein n=1 Tax=Dermacoccus nishinomiyaensis TaxID=1274 RepID=UPI003CD0CADB
MRIEDVARPVPGLAVGVERGPPAVHVEVVTKLLVEAPVDFDVAEVIQLRVRLAEDRVVDPDEQVEVVVAAPVAGLGTSEEHPGPALVSGVAVGVEEVVGDPEDLLADLRSHPLLLVEERLVEVFLRRGEQPLGRLERVDDVLVDGPLGARVGLAAISGVPVLIPLSSPRGAGLVGLAVGVILVSIMLIEPLPLAMVDRGVIERDGTGVTVWTLQGVAIEDPVMTLTLEVILPPRRDLFAVGVIGQILIQVLLGVTRLDAMLVDVHHVLRMGTRVVAEVLVGGFPVLILVPVVPMPQLVVMVFVDGLLGITEG